MKVFGLCPMGLREISGLRGAFAAEQQEAKLWEWLDARSMSLACSQIRREGLNMTAAVLIEMLNPNQSI